MNVDRSRLPEIGPDVAVRFPAIAEGRLRLGLSLRTVERADIPVLALVAIVPSGSAIDPAGSPGLAALTADLLDEGSGTRDAIAMHDQLARIGGQLDIEAGYDATIITLTTLSRFYREALDLLTDMVFRPRLDEDDFRRVRELRCNRLAQMRDLPAAQAEHTFVSNLFDAHPYGHLPIGSEASLRSLSVEDVRAFHRSRYRPDGTQLMAVGDVAHDTISSAASLAFDGLDQTGRVEFADVPPANCCGRGRRLVIVDRPEAPQSELRVGHVAVARSTPDYHSLVVLNALLGGQFVSRINLNLREDKGFTYGARSGFDWRRAPGPFVVQTSVQTDATAAAVSEILRELEDVRGRRPPTPRELTLAQASLTRGYPRNFETAEQVARALAQMALYDLPPTWFDEFIARIREVTGDTVLDSAERHLHPSEALVTVVGDRARIEPGLVALGFEHVVVADPV